MFYDEGQRDLLKALYNDSSPTIYREVFSASSVRDQVQAQSVLELHGLASTALELLESRWAIGFSTLWAKGHLTVQRTVYQW
jgi:hypothetical protein